MMLDHGRIEELLAVRALSGLDGDDVRDLENELRAHGPDCQECRRLEREFDETAAMIAFSLDPEPVDPGLADRILATCWELEKLPAAGDLLGLVADKG